MKCPDVAAARNKEEAKFLPSPDDNASSTPDDLSSTISTEYESEQKPNSLKVRGHGCHVKISLTPIERER